MKLNLLDLHDPQNDRNLRQCLRAYTVIPKYCKKPDEKNFKALEIHAILKTVEAKLRKKYDQSWAEIWKMEIPYKVQPKVTEDWVRGRVSIPLIAISALERLECEREVNAIHDKLEYISSTTGGPVRIPNKLTPDIIYLTGLILGDGCLPIIRRKENNFDYRVQIYSGDRAFLRRQILPIFDIIFQTNASLKRDKSSSLLMKKNKALFRFFTEVIGLPSGKKAEKAKIPEIFWRLDHEKLVPFLAGLIDSDIGKHGHGMGGTFRSRRFVQDMIAYLANLNIIAKSYKVYYKNGIYEQNDFTIPKSQINTLKEVLVKNYMPKRHDRLETILSRSHG